MHIFEDYNPPVKPWLDLIYEDEEILVLNKQSGLLSVPGNADERSDSLESRVKQKFIGARLVHRLDMPTSGIMVFARNKESQAHLSKQFEHRKTGKTYIARLAGIVADDKGVIDLPLICDWPNRPKQMVDFEKGKAAVTRFLVLARESEATRVRFFPKTGRSHQLRVHALSIGHPILGDNLYGGAENTKAAERLQLHAESLQLRHPTNEMKLEFFAPCPF
jgi:tRNA pseudouridine32 synthase/23S rRNA pseudouridine746 synthase